MEKFSEYVLLADKKLKLSAHLLEKTYPLVEDPKMLLSVMSGIYTSLRYALLGVLYFEYFFKRIGFFSESLEEQIAVFNDVSERYPYLKSMPKDLVSMKKLLDLHKESSVEYAKGDELRMYGDDFSSSKISYSDVSGYLSNGKVFIDTLIHNFDIKTVDYNE